MRIEEKRQLLEDVETLVKRPHQATENEINRTLINMQKLFSELFQMPSLKLKMTMSKEDYLNNMEKLKEELTNEDTPKKI